MPSSLPKPTNSIPPVIQPRPASSARESRHEAVDDEARLITEGKAADLLALSVKTLRNWRLSGYGPLHLKIGRLVRYRLGDLKAWLATCERASTSDRSDGHA
jgi:predicted DNA-binding transcriptional regulator AlpA